VTTVRIEMSICTCVDCARARFAPRERVSLCEFYI